MDDVTNTLDAAATAAQPSVRVRVVDATTRKTMNEETEVVFVPCADSEPIKVAHAALSQLPARRYLVKATAAGYAQLNYLEGPVNIYHDHLVVDQEGRPQKEVVIEMERRVAAVWLSVTDCRDGRALPTSMVQLLDEQGDVAHVFDAPGSHDVAAVTAATKTYSLKLHLRGYVLHGPTTVTLERGKRIDLLMTARRTDIKVVCRDLRSGRRIDDVDVSLINEENEALIGDTVDTDQSYRIVARAEGFRQVTRLQKCTFPPKLFEGSTAPLEVRVDLEPVKTTLPLAPPRRAVWGWLALDQPSERAPETTTQQKKPKKKTSEDWGTCTVNIRAVDATYQKPLRLAGARVRVDGNVSGETDERGALQLKLRAPSQEATSVTVQVEKDSFISDITNVRIQASQTAAANLALRRTIVRVDVVHASTNKPVTGDVDFELAPDDSRSPLPEVCEGDGLVLAIKHDRSTFDGVIAQRHRDENQTFYDVVGVDGSDLTLLKVRREDLVPTKENMLQRELEIGENVACLYPHAGRYRLTCKAPGLRLCGPSLRTFSSRDWTEKGPLQLTLRLEPSVARLRLACATEDGVPVSALADIGGERLELADDGSFSLLDVPLPRGKTQASVSLRVAAPQHVQVPPFETSLSCSRATEVVAYVRPCDVKLTAVAKGNVLKKATLQLIRVDANGDDDQIQVVQPGSRVAVDVGAEYRVTAQARGHRQVGLLKPFVATPETFLRQPGPVSLAVDMAPDVGALDLAVLDVVGRPVRHARVQVTYVGSRLPSLYLGHRRGVQELPLDGSEELEVDVTCDEEGYVQVSPSRIKVKAGRLRKTTVVLRRSDIVLRAVDSRTGAKLRADDHLRLELKPVDEGKTLGFTGAGGEVFGPAQPVDLQKAYRVCVDARRFKLVEPLNAVTFSRADFGVLEDHKHLAPLLERARDAARRKARRSGVDADRAEEQLRLEIDARLAKVVDVRVEPLVGDLNVEVIDARTGLPVPDISLVLKTASTEIDLGLQRGLVEDIPMSGGGSIIQAEVLVKSCDRVQLEPSKFDLRAGEVNDIQVYVRDADVVIHCVDAQTGDALIPDACYLEGGTTLDASDRCRVVIDRDYEVKCVVPRYRRLGATRFRVTRDDFRTLPDVETPFQVVVNFEPCETDIELKVEDAATGQVLSRAHVKIGPHSLGCTRGLESLRLPPSTRQITWPVAAQQQGWTLVAPRDVELHATPQHDDDPRQITILMRRCEVLVRAVDAITREPLDHAHCILEPANATTPMPWRLDDDDDACVVDICDGERTGSIVRVGPDLYDVAMDDGSEEMRCSADELTRCDGTEPSSYEADERVVVKRPRGVYVVRASCDGHRQSSHLDQMTFSLTDFAGLPVQQPLKLEVAMEAVAGVVDISVEDKRGAKIRTCEVWLDGVALGTQRGLVPINLPGGGKPHEARVDVSAPGYALVGPSRITVFAGHTTPLSIRLVATRCLIRVEDARDGAPIECRVCLVRERPRPRFDALPAWIRVGDRVEARLNNDWVEGTLEGEDPFAVQFDDGVIHDFEAGDLRPVSTYDDVMADPDLDPAFDGKGQNWCDWRTMSPLAIDCAPASYRVLVQDPQGEFRQVSHYEPVEFDVDELVKYKAAAREHSNDSLARKLLGKKKRRPEKKKGWFSWSQKEEEVKPPAKDDVSDGDKHAKVALVVVQVAPRVAAADFSVKDQSGKALKADVAIGGTNLGTRRGKVELDWCAIAPDAFLPPACSWRHAAGARADGSGVPCAVVATLDGYVQTSEDVVPFSSTGVTKFSVEMRKSTLKIGCYDAATQQQLTDVAVDLVPLDGQTGVRWTAGSQQEQRVAVGRAYRVVARGGRLRQTTPAVDEDVVFGRADWAQLDGEKPAELRVLLERRVATVEVKVLDASQQQETLLTHARCKVGATHFSQAEGWQQDVDLPCGRQAMREMPSTCTLDDYLQLPPKRCDVFVGDANNVNLVEMRMRPLSVSLRASSVYDDKAIEDVKWRLRPVSSDLPLVPLEARPFQVLRLNQKYTLECSVDGWRPCASNTEVEADSLIARFEGIDPKEPLPLDIKFEASSVPVRLNSISVENGADPDARTCVVEVAGKRVPYGGAVVDIPLPNDVDASQGCLLEVTASLPDASLTFLPHTIKCFPGTSEVTDVDCVFKALFARVTIVDKMDNELEDATYRLNGGSSVKSGQRASVHLGECTVECDAAGCRQTTFTEPISLIEQDFVKCDDGFERSLKVVCAPRMATINVSVTDATTNEALHRAAIEMRHEDTIVWTSVGTPADRKGVRRAVLDDVPGGGDDVELDCIVTLEGYTQIEPKTTLIRAGSAADAPWTCELLMRKYYVSLDVVDSNGKRVPGAGVELRSSEGSVAYQPTDIAEQAPQPIRLDTAYDVRPIISSLRGAGGEYFFRDAWHASDAPIVFGASDFEALERRARESMKRSVMKSDDPRYPFLKRVCERPTWRALHAWIQAAGVKRSGFDVALPPLKLAVRACPGRCAVDVRVVDGSGAPLSNAAVRMKTSDAWTSLKQGVQDVRVPGGGEARKVHFDAVLQGYLLETEHSLDLRASYASDGEEPTLVLLKLHPLTLRIKVTDGDQPARDARVSIMGGDGEETPLANRDGVCETTLSLDEALVVTASTDVTRHLTLRYSADDVRRLWNENTPGAPITCELDLARANAHVKVTVSDVSGKILEGAEVDLGGQRHSTGDVIEVPPLTELKGCSLPGYVLDTPSIGWRVPTDEDEIELRLTMRPTLITVKLVDARSGTRIDTSADVTLTSSDGTTLSGCIGDSLHITCGVAYDVQVTSSSDLKQVSHLDGCTFAPETTCLEIKVDVPARLVVDVRDADSGAPLPDAVLALNGTIVQRGAVDGYDNCTSLEVKATLPTYLQLTPSSVTLDPRRKTSLVVTMRACLVKVNVRDSTGDVLADARIRVDDRNINDWLVEPGREYALEVVSDGREVYSERVRFGAALFVDGPFTHSVLLNAASVKVDVTVVDAKGTPLNDAEVVLGDFVVGRDRGLCDVPLASKKTIELACRLSGFVLTKPRSLTIRRGETTPCRLTMRPATVTHSLEGAAVALVGVDGRVALPGSVQVGQTYTLTSSTHNVEERRLTFRDGDWDSLKGDDALELKIGVATSEGIQQEESDLVNVSITVVDADGGELPNASVNLGSVKLGTKRIAKVPHGTVPVKAKCPGYALVGPRSYDGAADLRVTMRRALVRARALVDGAELAGARVLFAKDDESPIERDCIDPDQSYAVTVALEDEAYRIVGATARWPGGSRSWNNPYVTVALPHDAWAESSQVQLDVMLVATKAELMVDVREEASGFPVHDATFAVSIGDAVTTFDEARGVLKVAVPSGRVDAVLDCEAPGCAAWSQKLSLRAGARCEVDVQMRRIDGDDASSASTRSMRPTTERTLDDVWAASRRCLEEAQSDTPRPAQIRADLDRYVLLRPKTVDLSYSNAVQPLTVTMRRCNLRGRCYDVRDGSSLDAAVEIEARDPERCASNGDVALNASYALRTKLDGWRQVTSLGPVTPLARHFSGGDAKKPLDVFVGLEPTHVNLRVRVEPSDATITVQGVSIKSGPASMKVEELGSRWVKTGDGLALPLKVQATRNGYVASMTTIYARSMPHRADVTLKMRRAEICIRCVDANGTLIEDAIDVVVENERHSLKFGGMDEGVFTEWVSTQKKVNRRDRSPALQALLTNEDDVRNELFVDGKEASSSRVLEVFTARGGSDGARLAAAAGRSGRGGVVVGASYAIRATHADYLCDEFERRFDAAAFVGNGPLVVDVPLIPVYCDVILRVVDAATGNDITDGDASIRGVHLGQKRTARLRLFEQSREPLDPNVVVTHATYAQERCTYEQLRPLGPVTLTVRMRPTKIHVTPTHGGEPVPLAQCSLVSEDKVLEANGPLLIELGVAYKVRVEHATLLKVGDEVVTFRAEQFLDEDLLSINVEMADKGASVQVDVVDEVTGDPIDCKVKLSGIEVGRSVDDVTWRRCLPIRATCLHKTMALVKAMLRVKRGDDATTDEVKASAEGALVPAYAPKADERASLILKMRSLQFRVVVNHATDSSFVFDDASVTIAPRDPTLVSTLKVEKQGAGWLVSQLPPCANGYSVWCAVGRAAQRKAITVTLDDLVRAPRNEIYSVNVTMEAIDGDVDLTVSDGEGSDVALGAHRVGGWRGAIKLIGVASGNLAVDAAADALVGECRVRAGSSQNVSLSRRRTVVEVVAKCDGVLLKDARCSLVDQEGSVLDLPGSVVVSTVQGSRDGSEIILDGGSRIKVPDHLIQEHGGRIKVPRRYYTLEVSRTGYRQVTQRDVQFAFTADQFLDGKYMLQVEMERCGAELSFDIVDSWGKPLDGVSLEVDGRPINDGRCGVETGVDEVRVVASKEGYVQLAPENCTARIHGRDTRIRVALGSYRLHAAVVDTDGRPVNRCEIDVYQGDQMIQPLGRFRRSVFVAPSLDSFAFRATLEGWRQTTESVEARLVAQHSTRAQALASVKFGAAFAPTPRAYSQRMYLDDRPRLPENWPRQSPRETACRRLKCWDEMRAFVAWRLHADVLPVSNEADVGRHGAVVLVVEKDAPVPAPAPAPDVTAAPVDEAPEKTARFHVVDVRTDAPLPDAQLIVDGAPQAQGIVASTKDNVEVRCELDGYVQLGPTSHSLDTGTNADMAAWATDSVELRMRPRDVRLSIIGEDGSPVEGVSVVLTHGEASLTATHDSVLVLSDEAYSLKCATPGWVSVSDTLVVSTEAFRASEEVLVRELRVERARVAVDVDVVDVTGAPIPDVSVKIGGVSIENGSLPYDQTQGDQPIEVDFPEASWIVLRPEKVNLEDASHVKVECRRCTCLVSVVEQYTQTTLSARVTCDDEEYEAGQSFEVKPGSYPLSVKLDNAETVQAYTLHATKEAFSSLEDDQPVIVTVEMRATETQIDLRVEDENGQVLDDATVTLDGEAHAPGVVHKPFTDEDERTFAVYASKAGYAFAGPSSFSVSRAKIGVPRSLVVRMRPALVHCTAVDEDGKALEDALVRLTPETGPEVKGVVDVDVLYKVDCTLRKYHRSGVRCDYGVVSRDGDDFCISFTDADFMRSSEPLQIEVTMEPARCVIDLSLVEETPTEAVLDTIQVDIGQRGFSTDRKWSAPLSELPERLAIDIKAKTHVLVGPTFMETEESLRKQTLCIRPALIEAVVYDEDRNNVEGADVWLKPVDDVHAASLVVLEAGAPQQCLVELGREYAVTCRKERTRSNCATFKATAEDLRALAPGTALRLEIEARRTRYASVDVQVRGLYDMGRGQDDPATLASVSINDDDLGPARGARDVEAADATLSTSCSLRGWAQLPPYTVPVGEGATSISLEMVPALIKAVPSTDVDVECWLEGDDGTIQVPTSGFVRVQVDIAYTLRAKAPGMRLANSRTVTFTREQFWEASRKMEEPPSSDKPVVVDLELLLEPSICELALDVNSDDCTLTLERSGLPDLSLERGSQVVEGLPAATVSTVVRASLKGHAQLKPLEPITLAAAQKHAVAVELRPASVLCKCIDARTGSELANARVRYECGGEVQYGSRRAPVVVDPAHYRGCVIVESVGDAYRIQRDDGELVIVDADRLRGSDDEWSRLERGPPSSYVYEVNESIISGKRHGTIASIKDTLYHVEFDDGAADVDASRLRPLNYDFRRHLPTGLRCEVRTGGQYNIVGELKGWRQLDYTSPHIFENEAFVALGGPIKPEVPDWDASVTTPLSTSSKSLWMRFLKPDLGRALRTWHFGAEATREARAQEGKLIAPPLRLAMRLVPGVGSVDLNVKCDGRDVDADISLIPVVKSDADPSIILGARRGIINNLAVAGAGEPALYKVEAKKFGYRVMEPSTISLKAGECTSVSVHLASCLAKVNLVSHASRKPFAGDALVKVVSSNEVLASVEARNGKCSVPVDPRVACKLVVDAPRHEQTSQLTNVTWTPSDFEKGVKVDIALKAIAVTLDVSVVDAATGAELPAANVVVGGFDIGLRRGLVDVADLSKAGLVRMSAALEGYHMLPPYNVEMVHGSIVQVALRLRRFEVVLNAAKRKNGILQKLASAEVALYRDNERLSSLDGVYGVEPGVRYAIIARCDGHRQASLTEALTFAPEHFDDGLSDRLELTVELESELFEALVRVVDDETGAPLDGAVLQLDGFETCGPTPVTGWRRIGKKLEGVAGPAVFLPCVAAAPRRVQTSTARVELRNDGAVPCTTLRLRRASIAVRVLDDEGRAVQDPVVQVGLSTKGPEEVSTPRVGTAALDRRRQAPAYVRPRNEVLVVLDHFYDVRVVHDAMRQRDLLDPQRFEVMDFGRKQGDAALTVRMEPYRCAVDLKVVDAFGDDLPHARVRLGDHELGTRRGVLDLGPNGAVVQPEEE